jgi:hypothetical protein
MTARDESIESLLSQFALTDAQLEMLIDKYHETGNLEEVLAHIESWCAIDLKDITASEQESKKEHA